MNDEILAQMEEATETMNADTVQEETVSEQQIQEEVAPVETSEENVVHKVRGPERAFVTKEGVEKKQAIADALIKGVENMSRFHMLQLIELGYITREEPAKTEEKRGRGRPSYQYLVSKKGKTLMGWRKGIGKDKTAE
jgi:hypothetical protein